MTLREWELAFEQRKRGTMKKKSENPKKSPTSIRLSDEAERLRDALTIALGVGKTSVIELALRELAKRHGVK